MCRGYIDKSGLRATPSAFQNVEATLVNGNGDDFCPKSLEHNRDDGSAGIFEPYWITRINRQPSSKIQCLLDSSDNYDLVS
jgi:hypothetical protein